MVTVFSHKEAQKDLTTKGTKDLATEGAQNERRKNLQSALTPEVYFVVFYAFCG